MSTEKGTEEPQNGQSNPKNEKHDAFEKVTLATAIVGVVILCIYTGLTGYQAYISKDTAERQLRAYISAVVEKQPDLDGASPPEIIVLYKNNGQTPAFHVNARFGVFSTDAHPTEAEIEANKVHPDTKSESILFPGQEFRESTIPGVGIPMTQQQKIAVSMGAKILWLDGEVTYADAFGYPRFTHFRLYMGGAKAARYHKFIWADTGNEGN